jgi:ribosomal protein L37AE/L43A
MAKKPREYMQGECPFCSNERELQRPDSTNEWCCLPCLNRMNDRAKSRARELRIRY